ncbi:MAG TPA: carbohydrate kinase, partial [Bacteroidaceae bacterium]|nr:carbohydrate kinase [Bacteroidaceae bacterium]
MKKEVLLVFDIGKTNKKVLLFDMNFKVLHEEETRFAEVLDDDGFTCDDGDKLEKWIDESLALFLNHDRYNVRAINFTTYGATLIYVDENGKRLTPVYNYLKSMPDKVLEGFYEKYGGIDEFSRQTASPAMGMLNSGLQALWLKKEKKGVFNKVMAIMHLPQYLSFRLTGKITSEHTSIGCHTALWDFDRMQYHQWIKDEFLSLPDPLNVSTVFPAEIEGKTVDVGIGIHDSSASLAPYILNSKEPFILVSTGTWCISMNPFNHSPLTAEE